MLPKPKPCVYERRIYADNSTWSHDCNTCTCVDGKVQCSRVWCGPPNCLYHPNQTRPAVTCGAHETCVTRSNEICFTPPCLPWGTCHALDKISEVVHSGVNTNCLPNSAVINNNCVKLTLVFDKSKMPTVSCFELI